MALAAEAFPGNFSGDLLTGLPFQDEGILLEDIGRLLALEPGHVSLYALTVEEGTPLGERTGGTERGLVRQGFPSQDEADRLWILARDALEAAGYEQYEVSNFCRPGKESLHNIRYWRMEEWLALGPSGSGTVILPGEAGAWAEGRRRTVEPCLERWLSRRPGEGVPLREERLDGLTLMKECFLMGYRYRGGPDPGRFQARFGMSPEEAAPGTMKAWRDRGLLGEAGEGASALTKEGLLLLDRFLVEVFRELEGWNGRALAHQR
jgi:oxygen-independent coproporphyrinogen-3 oxidase